MVWIVAAAVALGGCDKDDPKDNGDDDATPSLAVALDPASAAMGGATDSSDVKVTVTFANEAAADKTASVALTVVCDDDGITVADQDATDATDGVAAWDDVKVPLGVAGKCTFTAKATLGEEERSHSAEFTITAATPDGDLVAHELSFESPAAADASSSKVKGTSFEVKVKVTPMGGVTTDLDDDASVTIKYACDAAVATLPTMWEDFSSPVTGDAPKDGSASADMSVTIPPNDGGYHCWIQACAKVGVSADKMLRIPHCATLLVITG